MPMLLFMSILAAGAGSPSLGFPPAFAASLSPCEQAIVTGDPNVGAAQYRAAQRSNRLADYRAFLAAHRSSACASAADEYIMLRESAVARIASGPKVPNPVAVFRGSLTDLFTSDDYPPSALRAGQQGRVTVEFDVLPDGYVENCRVVTSSGSQFLDDATCSIIKRRARYEPARDASGAPIISMAHLSMNWRLPADTPSPMSHPSN